MKLYRTGLLLLAVLCTIPVFAGQPPRLKVGSSSGIFGPVTNWTYETFAEAKRAGIDAIEISASTLFLNLSLIHILVGHSFLKTKSRTSYIDAQNYPSPAFDVASVAANIVDASAGLSEYAIESYFARLSLAYKDRYVVNATIRTDGSSRFAPDCRWGWFPSRCV